MDTTGCEIPLGHGVMLDTGATPFLPTDTITAAVAHLNDMDKAIMGSLVGIAKALGRTDVLAALYDEATLRALWKEE